MNARLHPVFLEAPVPSASTAYGIERAGPARMSGKHLSLDPNSPELQSIEDAGDSDASAIVAGFKDAEDREAFYLRAALEAERDKYCPQAQARRDWKQFLAEHHRNNCLGVR